MAEDAFKPIGMVPSHAFVLMALDEKSETFAGELAETMGLAPSTITRFVDKLEKDGLCVRRLAGRQAVISISNNGLKKLSEIHAAWKVL